MARKRQALRCTARNHRGLPCGNFSVLGMRVCRMHGGDSPQARHAARLTLARDGASRLLASMHYDDGRLVMDGRIGPRRADSYGYLTPNRRERYLAARTALREVGDLRFIAFR
ncbi:MAG TPA: hypothetical protein VFQ44_18785 [Streptosporangiaceae bacterium]|nr:hypothetical protein [Streptosporangiaceae bacterium]